MAMFLRIFLIAVLLRCSVYAQNAPVIFSFHVDEIMRDGFELLVQSDVGTLHWAVLLDGEDEPHKTDLLAHRNFDISGIVDIAIPDATALVSVWGIEADTDYVVYAVLLDQDEENFSEVSSVPFTSAKMDLPNEIRFSGFADTYITNELPYSNFGIKPQMRLDSNIMSAILVSVHMPIEAGLQFNSALLRLHISELPVSWGSSGGYVALHRLLVPWTEFGATWQCTSDLNPTNGESNCAHGLEFQLSDADVLQNATFAEAKTGEAEYINNDRYGWLEFNVTDDVRKFLSESHVMNYGWVLVNDAGVKDGQAGSLMLDTTESDWGPELVLSFTNDEEQKGFGPVCDGDEAHLICPEGKVIKIEYASFGRHNDWSCPREHQVYGMVENQQCHTANSVFKMSQACNHKEECSVTSSERVFGEPCRHTVKYLEGRYACVDPVDFCSSSPCNADDNAECVNTFEGYVCICSSPYIFGVQCDSHGSPHGRDNSNAAVAWYSFEDRTANDNIGIAHAFATDVDAFVPTVEGGYGYEFSFPSRIAIPPDKFPGSDLRGGEAFYMDSDIAVTFWVKPYQFTRDINQLIDWGTYDNSVTPFAGFGIRVRGGTRNAIEATICLAPTESRKKTHKTGAPDTSYEFGGECYTLTHTKGISTNHWHFIGFVFSKHTMTLLVDDDLQTRNDLPSTRTWLNTNRDIPIMLGTGFERSQYQFEGVIDDVLFFSEALGADEMEAIRDSSKFADPTILTAGVPLGNTNLLGLLAHYPFDDETFDDVMMKDGHNGEMTGTVSSVKGVAGRAVVIKNSNKDEDEQASAVKVEAQGSGKGSGGGTHSGTGTRATSFLDRFADNVTMAFWVKPVSWPSPLNVIVSAGVHGQGGDSSLAAGWGVYQEYDHVFGTGLGSIHLRLERRNGRQTLSLPGIELNKWHFVAFAFTEKNQIFVVDTGIVEANVTTGGPLIHGPDADLWFGANDDDSTIGDHAADMALDEVMLFNSYLDTWGISALRSTFMRLRFERSDLYDYLRDEQWVEESNYVSDLDLASISPVGCSDGTREAFSDMDAYPNVAACAGQWGVPGIANSKNCSDAMTYQCGGYAGNDADYELAEYIDPDECSVADLCAVGWHVCSSAEDVRDSTPDADGCLGVDDWPSNSFFATRQTGPGGRECGNDGVNDVFGCGTQGDQDITFQGPTTSVCNLLTRFSFDECKALSGNWFCPGRYEEAVIITHSSSADGGVLCCRDRGEGDNAVTFVNDLSGSRRFMTVVVYGSLNDVDREFEAKLLEKGLAQLLDDSAVTENDITVFRAFPYTATAAKQATDAADGDVFADIAYDDAILYYVDLPSSRVRENLKAKLNALTDDDNSAFVDYFGLLVVDPLDLKVCSDLSVRSDCTGIISRRVTELPCDFDFGGDCYGLDTWTQFTKQDPVLQAVVAIVAILAVLCLLYYIKRLLGPGDSGFQRVIEDSGDFEIDHFDSEDDDDTSLDNSSSAIEMQAPRSKKKGKRKKKSSDQVTVHNERQSLSALSSDEEDDFDEL